MTFEGDDEYTDVPGEMFAEGEDEAVLAPVFVGHRMEAELVRSLLEANNIPATVFGSGGFAYGAENAGPNERVMVRSDHVEVALEAIRNANLGEDGVVEPTQGDMEAIGVDEDEEWEFDDEDNDDAYADSTGVELLAQGSDWGPRIVGLIGVAALVIAVIVLLLNS